MTHDGRQVRLPAQGRRVLEIPFTGQTHSEMGPEPISPMIQITAKRDNPPHQYGFTELSRPWIGAQRGTVGRISLAVYLHAIILTILSVTLPHNHETPVRPHSHGRILLSVSGV